MAGEDAAGGGTAAVKKLPNEEEEDDDDELDNVPLAVSRAKKAGIASASKVKKEEDDDDEEDNLPISHSRAKKGNEKQKGTVNSNTKTSKVKKQEVESDDDDFMPTLQKKKNASAGASNAKASKVKKLKDEDLEDLKENKKRKKRVGVKEGAKMTIVKGEKVKKERKVYELPGQKHDPPADRDPLRIFYESLYEQIPTSDMAATWLMEWGLLPLDVARKFFEKKQGQKLKSPVKTTVSKRKPTSPTKTPASSAMKSVSAKKSAGKPTSQKKRKASSESDDDDDFVMAPKAKTKRQKACS
ncbi:ABC transporter F family member 4 [Panicum miliaceum]|uniref:ABC transporter F family member 4 n=1 Tax=Panicum miliaceum TaxID=4540 RepID=A0A3L6TIX1_PANMI|nr:ABC transporter F family member 4 [Panicum miliaceum]